MQATPNWPLDSLRHRARCPHWLSARRRHHRAHDATNVASLNVGTAPPRCAAAGLFIPEPAALSDPCQSPLLDDDGTPGAAARPELAGIAERLPAGVRPGTSSWSFPGWAGLVYDRTADRSLPARRGLAACAAHPLFTTVCIDRSFHGPLSVAEWRGLAEQMPAGFRSVVKAPATVTLPWCTATACIRRCRRRRCRPRACGRRRPAPWVARWNLGHGQRYAAARARYRPFNRRVDPDPASRDEIAAGIRAATRDGEAAYVTVNNKAEGSAPLSAEALAGAVVADGGCPSPA